MRLFALFAILASLTACQDDADWVPPSPEQRAANNQMILSGLQMATRSGPYAPPPPLMRNVTCNPNGIGGVNCMSY